MALIKKLQVKQKRGKTDDVACLPAEVDLSIKF